MTTLLMLGAVNKQIRTEARSLFWAKSDFVVVTSNTYQHEGVRRFLTTIGSVGRASIQVLDVQHSREGQFPCAQVTYILESKATKLRLAQTHYTGK
jgi:hypothetical protein